MRIKTRPVAFKPVAVPPKKPTTTPLSKFETLRPPSTFEKTPIGRRPSIVDVITNGPKPGEIGGSPNKGKDAPPRCDTNISTCGTT